MRNKDAGNRRLELRMVAVELLKDVQAKYLMKKETQIHELSKTAITDRATCRGAVMFLPP